MVQDWDDFYEPDPEEFPDDEAELEAIDVLGEFFEQNRERVFYSRQLYVLHEDRFFHWVTGRAVRDLVRQGVVKTENRPLAHGGEIHLYWHKSFRYYKRSATSLLALVHEYATSTFGELLGERGETLVHLGFSSNQFVMLGRNTREYGEKEYTATKHDLDFIFERDGRAYGVEVKNTLTYPDYDEFRIKTGIATHLGITPVFVARMLPRTWIHELNQEAGGFALILKWQLYPLSHKDLAKRVKEELGLSVDAPRVLAEQTMRRFIAWHEKKL